MDTDRVSNANGISSNVYTTVGGIIGGVVGSSWSLHCCSRTHNPLVVYQLHNAIIIPLISSGVPEKDCERRANQRKNGPQIPYPFYVLDVPPKQGYCFRNTGNSAVRRRVIRLVQRVGTQLPIRYLITMIIAP